MIIKALCVKVFLYLTGNACYFGLTSPHPSGLLMSNCPDPVSSPSPDGPVIAALHSSQEQTSWGQGDWGSMWAPHFQRWLQTPPLPKEMRSASIHTSSCKEVPHQGNLPCASRPTGTATLSHHGVVQAHICSRRWLGGLGFAERKWLNLDMALFVFPGKNRDHFPLFFYFRDQADSFNSSSFLLSTGVSYSDVVGKAEPMT